MRPSSYQYDQTKKFKIVLDKGTNEMEEMAGNITKHQIRNNYLHSHFFIACNVETMIVETNNQSKLEELRKNINKSYTIKSAEHYSEDIKCKRNIFVMEEKIA